MLRQLRRARHTRSAENRARTDRYTTVGTEYGHVMLDQVGGQYWHLNESALLISRCLQAGGSREDAAGTLVDTYGIDADRARRDVDLACEQLREVGLL